MHERDVTLLVHGTLSNPYLSDASYYESPEIISEVAGVIAAGS